MTGFELLVAAFMIGVVIESIVDAVKGLLGLANAKPALWYGIAVLLGVAVCLIFKVNILREIGLSVKYVNGAWFAKIVSGIVLGCFANFIHLIKKKLRGG